MYFTELYITMYNVLYIIYTLSTTELQQLGWIIIRLLATWYPPMNRSLFHFHTGCGGASQLFGDGCLPHHSSAIL